MEAIDGLLDKKAFRKRAFLHFYKMQQKRPFV